MNDSARHHRQAELKRAFENAHSASTVVKQSYSTLRFSTRTIDDSYAQMSSMATQRTNIRSMHDKAKRMKQLYGDLTERAEQDYSALQSSTVKTSLLLVANIVAAAAKLCELITAVDKVRGLVTFFDNPKLRKLGTACRNEEYDTIKKLPGIAEAGTKQEALSCIAKSIDVLGFAKTSALLGLISKTRQAPLV